MNGSLEKQFNFSTTTTYILGMFFFYNNVSSFAELQLEERCILLNWNTLQHRREYLSVVECYKTVFGLNGLDFDDYFEFCRSKNTRTNHPYKIQTKLAKVNSFKYSFFVSIVKDWNCLPNLLFTDEINLNKFKKGLKRWMKIY